MFVYPQRLFTKWKRNYIVSTHDRTSVGVTVLFVCRRILINHSIDTQLVIKRNNLFLYFKYDVETLHLLLLLLKSCLD